MRKLPLLLAGSLVLNALFAAGWAWSALHRPGVAASAVPKSVVGRGDGPPASRPTLARAGEAATDWRQWVAGVRGLGVPDAILASLVQADFERRWEQRSRALELRRLAGEIDEEAIAQELGDHDEEQARELRAALGEAGFVAWEKEQVLRSYAGANPPVTDAEGEQLYRLRKESEAKRRELNAAHARGEIDAAALDAAFEALGEAQANQVKSILGEGRSGTENLAQDSARAALRRQFQKLNLPSDQIEALADLDQARTVLENGLDQQSDAAAPSDRGQEAQRLAIRDARDRAFERIVGPETFQAWQRMNDPRWQSLQKFAPAWNLDPQQAGQVYALLQQRDAAVRERQLQALSSQRGGAATDWTAVQRDLEAQAQGTTNALRQLLGPERFQRLEQNGVFASP